MKKTRNHSSIFCISFSKPLDLSLTIKKKIKIIISDEIQCQSKGQKVNPISNAPILNYISYIIYFEISTYDVLARHASCVFL